MVEGCCCNSSAPVVAPCIDCLVTTIGHISGTEVVDTVLVAPGTALADLGSQVANLGPELDTQTGIELAALDAALAELDIGPDTQTGIGNLSLFSAPTESRHVPCYQ